MGYRSGVRVPIKRSLRHSPDLIRALAVVREGLEVAASRCVTRTQPPWSWTTGPECAKQASLEMTHPEQFSRPSLDDPGIRFRDRFFSFYRSQNANLFSCLPH